MNSGVKKIIRDSFSLITNRQYLNLRQSALDIQSTCGRFARNEFIQFSCVLLNLSRHIHRSRIILHYRLLKFRDLCHCGRLAAPIVHEDTWISLLCDTDPVQKTNILVRVCQDIS
jgi:hypothetical protein